MKVNGLAPDNVTYTSVIGVLCNAIRLEEAVAIFEQTDESREVPCVYVSKTMMMQYGLSRMFNEAYSLIERQKAKGCIASVVAYNCILTCLGKQKRVAEALMILEEMKKDAMPNITTCNILIEMVGMAGNLEDALKVRDAMQETGLFPNVVTVNMMVDRLCKAQRLDEACSIFEGTDYKICHPDAVTFCSLIDGVGKHGRVDDAYGLYEKILDSDQVPNAIIYTSLIRNFIKCGRKEDGHKIYKEMFHSDCSPDLMLLNTYMGVFKALENEKDRALFEEIKAQRFISNVLSYSILIHGLVKAGFAHETYHCFYPMKEQGCVLDTHA